MIPAAIRWLTDAYPSSTLGHIQEVPDGAQDEAGLSGEVPGGPEEAQEKEPRQERQQVREQGERGELDVRTRCCVLSCSTTTQPESGNREPDANASGGSVLIINTWYTAHVPHLRQLYSVWVGWEQQSELCNPPIDPAEQPVCRCVLFMSLCWESSTEVRVGVWLPVRPGLFPCTSKAQGVGD